VNDDGTRGVDIRVLGTTEVSVGGLRVDVGGPQVRAVLALLAAGAGHVVSVAALVDGLWGHHAPLDADRTARTYVSRLRKALEPALAAISAPELITTRPPGYLVLDPDTIDAVRFERLVWTGRQAQAAGASAVARKRLVTALDLWRGTAYGEFADISGLAEESLRLDRLRRHAVADRVDLDLAAGQGEELVAELEDLTAKQPGHERLCGQLMTALYRSGRQTDALTAFRRARRALAEGAGLEPSPLLTDVHRQILAQDPGLLASRSATAPDVARPAQLPPAVSAFTGRSAELAALDLTLREATDTIAVAALYGRAGVGKTALAVHWAHQVAADFPDGQFYADLHGDTGPALDPAEALQGFLAAFAVPQDRIPTGVDARTALFRSLTADKRVLVVLDNARDSEQVRPLLPASAGSMIVVTSRNNLVGLVARDGARRIALDALGFDEAVALLGALIGERRGKPDTLTVLAQRLSRLPLALRMAADLLTADAGRHKDSQP
jgi:DNA-binding SARP family transcriptional activator